MLCLCVAIGACGGASFNEDRERAFGSAVEASVEEDYERAASAAAVFLATATNDDERYDRAQMLLGESLEKLGLRYPASLLYLDVASARRNIELLDKAFIGLERILRAGPHDHETLVEGFLATADITGLRPEQQAFVDYYQAEDSLRRGLDAWADGQFARIPESSPYYARALYLKAVRMLGTGAFDEGREALLALLRRNRIPVDLRQDSQIALARLAMEQQQYDEAVRRYESVRDLAPERPDLLLEMAWAQFYRGDSRRALGLLVGLDAPLYRRLIAPERYLLEASCLRRLCQFEPARTAATRLETRYGAALADLHSGVAPAESAALRAAASRRGPALDERRFMTSLVRERRDMGDLELDDVLVARLEQTYADGLRASRRRLDARTYDEANVLAAELVEAEDGVRVTLHELSVALLRGRQRPPGPEEAEAVDLSAASGRTSFQFEGEFWTDELDDLVVAIEDRCLE